MPFQGITTCDMNPQRTGCVHLHKAYKQLHIRKRKANHEDKGKGSDGDGIQNRKQLADIRQAFFCKGTFVGLRDLVAFDWDTGVFCEVTTRGSCRFRTWACSTLRTAP
ncbi:hypothetical protein L202_05859 [Cryptococcus amylolentus CBS 6039]|uniref:Uncharacterized protein n=1 Tax=Cryptococcus amylolentus CBS 6039 TaxID=1295533 RepID=A0A1E3HK91_9TREE|nr:hypothetical protein L202_05859 [Cryptococcus amylolentus CBS 6039]ODN75871.1 hypothetical protein L202_05859 [Cryptococcus amylolentus CBS 6039]